MGGETFVVAETGAADFLLDRGELEVPTDVKIGHVSRGVDNEAQGFSLSLVLVFISV
jgi:hypothetical protein